MESSSFSSRLARVLASVLKQDYGARGATDDAGDSNWGISNTESRRAHSAIISASRAILAIKLSSRF